MKLCEPQKKLAQTLVNKGLGVPTILFLESMKPVSVLAQQSLYATGPLAAFGGFRQFHSTLSSVFESREMMEEMLLEVEDLMESKG